MTENDSNTPSTSPKQPCCGGGSGPVIAIVLGIIVIVAAVFLVNSVNTRPVEDDAGDTPGAVTDTGDTADTDAMPDDPSAAQNDMDSAADDAAAKTGDEAPPDDTAAEDAAMQPMPIELPHALYQGTPKIPPKNIRIDKKQIGKVRPPFMVPEGVTLLSVDKPVESSDAMPLIGDVELVTDGDKEALDGRWVELAPGLQHGTIDLEQPHAIYAVVIWHHHATEGRVYRDVIVQTAMDAAFTENVVTHFNNDHDNSANMGVGEDYEYFEDYQGKLIDCGGTVGRYVRCWSNGNTDDDQNHYIEVEVWGRAPKE